MKSRMLMAALVVVMLMGVRTYAHDCGPCSEVDPCGACNGCAKSCDLFSGLKKLVACSPCAASECNPCDAIVACTPCGETTCDPCGACGDFGCNDGCGRKFAFGSRLKALFASKGCNPCDEVACGPCDNVCGPCDDICGPCDNPCGSRGFSFRGLFRGFGKLGCCDTGCDPCGACNTDCDPCGACCDPCGNACDPCGACNTDCDPCGACNGCGVKFGRLLDGPRRNLKKLFSGLSFSKCNPCGPCDPCGNACDPCGSCCNPCDLSYGAAAAPSQLPE